MTLLPAVRQFAGFVSRFRCPKSAAVGSLLCCCDITPVDLVCLLAAAMCPPRENGEWGEEDGDDLDPEVQVEEDGVLLGEEDFEEEFPEEDPILLEDWMWLWERQQTDFWQQYLGMEVWLLQWVRPYGSQHWLQHMLST